MPTDPEVNYKAFTVICILILILVWGNIVCILLLKLKYNIISRKSDSND